MGFPTEKLATTRLEGQDSQSVVNDFFSSHEDEVPLRSEINVDAENGRARDFQLSSSTSLLSSPIHASFHLLAGLPTHHRV